MDYHKHKQAHSSSMAVNLDPNNMFNFVVNEGNGVKGLVDTGLSMVPEQYIHPPHERITNKQVDARAATPLPVIDLSGIGGPQSDQVVEALVKAAETFGFFQVVSHGLPIQLLEELKDSAHDFFNQPAEKKKVYLKGVSPTALVTYGTSFVPEKEKVFEWVDTLLMSYSNDDDALTYWPDPFKEVVLKYLKASTVLAERILQFLLRNLGVAVDNSVADTYTGGKSVLMNFYPPCPEPDLTIGLGRHTDFGTLTVLLQDDVGGLFVKLENEEDVGDEGEWIEITPLPGALVIMVGDSLEILSNGKYKSAEHRVRTSSTRSRVSIPAFLNPKMTAKIGPLPQVAEKDGGSRYRECVFGEYKDNAFMQGYQGKKKTLDFAKVTSPVGS